MITIVPYNPAWPAEFASLAAALRTALGDLAQRIDHIGSTAVPGLAAKDVIDIQITAAALTPPIELALTSIGYQRLPHITHDHIPPNFPPDQTPWQKWFFKPLPTQRPTNLHVRIAGHPNQRYPLLFRDYLRSHPSAAAAYAQAKLALAKHHPNNPDAYYDIKDPVCDIIVTAAESWAKQIEWKHGPSSRVQF
jgi:GrpB-like predicted nucleotidyltransferase (UPF0157 family)